MPSSTAAYAAPTNSRLFQLLQAVEVAHETKRAAPCRRDEMSDSHQLVAHDDVLVQSWRAPLMRPLIQPINAAEPRRAPRHGTSDSHRLVANDHAILNNFELPGGAEERRHFDRGDEGAPDFLEKQPSRDSALRSKRDSAVRGLPYFFGSRCASA